MSLFHDILSDMRSEATFSTCGLYRYNLLRVWNDMLPRACWIMLNPSTATATTDDPTIRRCMGFARAWGYGGIEVVNLFAWRATDPAELLTQTSEKVGPDNDQHILESSARCGVRIAAWGVHGKLGDRGRHVLAMLTHPLREVYHLGLTKDGYPRHPLYVKGDTKLTPFVAARAEAGTLHGQGDRRSDLKACKGD